MQGLGHLRARGPVKMQGSGHPPRDGPGRSGRRARENAGILALPCAGTRKNVRIRTRWVSGSSCTGAWPAWWRRPGHSGTSTGRLLGRPLQREVHAARATAGRPRSPFCARSCAGIGKNVWIRACAGRGKCRDLGIPVRGDSEQCVDSGTPLWASPCAGAHKNAWIRTLPIESFKCGNAAA